MNAATQYGVVVDYDILKIEVPGLTYDEEQAILAPLEGKKLTETVVSNNGCNLPNDPIQPVETGKGCTIGANGIFGNTCRDVYGLCLSSKTMYPSGTCTEIYTQKMFVAGVLAETWQITFVITNTPTVFSGNVTRIQTG